MKPSWDDAPEWANYLAMDENGTWRWFEYEPSFYFNGTWMADNGRAKTAFTWGESIEARPIEAQIKEAAQLAAKEKSDRATALAKLLVTIKVWIVGK